MVFESIAIRKLQNEEIVYPIVYPAFIALVTIEKKIKMPSVTIIFRRDKVNRQGSAPIHLRIIKDRRISYISTGIMLPQRFWDEKNKKVKAGFPNSKRWNSLIANKYAELQDQVFEHETILKSTTTRQLREKIYGRRPTDFFPFAIEMIERYRIAGQIGSYNKNRSIIKKLKEYCGEKQLCFQDITPSFLMKYDSHLREKLGNTTNTIHKDFKFLRKLFNDAYRLELIEHNQNPFNRFQLRTEKTQRSFLTESELSAIESFQAPTGTRLRLHKDMFIFSSYAGGLRISDVLQLRWKNFDGTHIHCTIKKTGQQHSIKLPQKSIEIVKMYSPKKLAPESFIFPMLPDGLNLNDPLVRDREISSATAYINKNLKIIAAETGIDKKLSFHVSRHTWATRALRKGISIDKVSKILGHAAIRETLVYAKIVNEELDKAMDVFNS